MTHPDEIRGAPGAQRSKRDGKFARPLARCFRRLAGDRRGSVAPMLAFMLIPLVGSMALAGELSSWFMTNRSLQNAADSAAVAAATNGDTGAGSGSGHCTTYVYQSEACAVTAKYGFTDGSNNVTVSVTTTTASPCPSGDTCYAVTITKKVPLYLVQITGYAGNTTLSGANAESLSATAIASPGASGAQFCVLALGSGGVTLTVHGGPDASMPGCDVGSDGSMTCTGHDMGADAGYAVGTDSNCGAVTHSSQPTISDPYESLASSIPANTCSPATSSSSYPQEPGKKGPALPASNQINSSFAWTAGTTIICGDAQLTGNVTVPSTTTKVVIENGQLDTNNNSFTLNGTLIFTGPTVSGLTPTQVPTGGGTLNITAPTAGTFSGIAIYQDPNLSDANGGLDVSAAGNAPTWNIVGMNYFPNSNFTISGDVGGGETGACQGFVVNSMIVNGTGYIVDNNGCKAVGLTLPSYAASRVALVE